jgi:hypothetical protein
MANFSVMTDVPNPVFDSNGNPFSGAVLKAFLPGGTTGTSIAIDKDGASPQASITYNAQGKLEVSGNEILPFIDLKHKWGIFANAADAAANTPFYMGPFDDVPAPSDESNLDNRIDRLNPDTQAAAIADSRITLDDVLKIKEKATGEGGGADWEVVLLSTVTTNLDDTFALTGGQSPALAMKRRDDGRVQTTVEYTSGLTLINSDTKLIDAEISQIDNTKQVVITGDSLGFNGFGYPAPFGVDGGDYATENPFGMSSWAHLFRDLWVTSGFFQPIKTSKYYSDADTFLAATFGVQNIAINQRALGFNFSAGETLTIENEYTGSPALLISSQPTGENVTFDLNGVPQATLSATGDYKGYEFLLLPFTGDSAIIDNVVNPGAGDVNIIIYGIVPSTRSVPKLTSKGGYTSTQILAEYSTLVAPFSPDIIFYIVGANDAALGNPDASGYNASVQSFIDLARTAKPDSVIVLISMPATSSFTDARILAYTSAGREMALANDCSHVDLFAATRNIDPSYWRFDNIHANTKGDTLWFNIFKDLIFPNAAIDVEKLTPVREAQLGLTINSMARGDESHKFLLRLTTTTPTITALKSSLGLTVTAEYVTVSSEAVCKITAPKGYKVSVIDNLVASATQTEIIRAFQETAANDLTCRVTGISNNTTVNPDGTDLFANITIIRDNSIV